MPAKPRKVPSYRLHKPTGQAVVRLDGRDIYLGKHGTEESQEAYRRKIAEWLTAGTAAAPAGQGGTMVSSAALTVSELIAAFWEHAERHYRHADGTPTTEIPNYRNTLRPLRRLYGGTLAADFGPLKLKAVRQALIDSGLCRKTVNQRIGRLVRVFKWAVENELVPPSVHHGLKAVAGLRKGRSDARETEPVKPVPDAYVEAIKPHVSRHIWAMIQLQRLTGMRPGEVAIMRTCDLDTSGRVWVFKPERSKMEHLERPRTIYLGPKAQEILKPWLRTELTAYLFSSAKAMAEQSAERRRSRKTPLTPSQRARKRKRNPRRAPGVRYTTRSHYHTVMRACRRAGVPGWHPNQLRHNAATLLRKEFGVDTARVILGHSTPVVTEVYAELDEAKAFAAMERVG
jgi:integrase